MSSFCRPCTTQLAGPEYADRNDFVLESEETPSWDICEGCGWHIFTWLGEPLCGHQGGDTIPEDRDLCSDCPDCQETIRG